MANDLFSIFNKFPNLFIGISEKKDGPMKFSGSIFRNIIVRKNRNKYFNVLGISSKSVVSSNLIHGSNVATVIARDAGNKIDKTDGLLTSEKSLFLSITVADCLPIFFYDYEKKVIGLIHAGWRSLAKNILSKAIERAINDYASNPQNIIAGIGPGIAKCHFEVRKDALICFKPLLSEFFIRKKEKTFLDLKKIAKLQLMNLGIKEENIEVNSGCTYCLEDKYYSYRRDKPKSLQTMIVVIGMR